MVHYSGHLREQPIMRAARELKDDVFRNLRFVAYPTPPFRQNDPLKILLANTDALKLSEYL